MPYISKKDLAYLAIGFGVADFFLEGRLQAPIARGTKRAIVKAAPAIGRAIITHGPTVVRTAARLTPGPVAGAALGVAAIQNRERIADTAGNIYERVAPVVGGITERALDPSSYDVDLNLFDRRLRPRTSGSVAIKPKKRMTKFNKAVKAGMSVVRKSTSYGKKGTINNAKKAFSAVTKVASSVNKGTKVAKTGIKGKIARAIKRIL